MFALKCLNYKKQTKTKKPQTTQCVTLTLMRHVCDILLLYSWVVWGFFDLSLEDQFSWLNKKIAKPFLASFSILLNVITLSSFFIGK